MPFEMPNPRARRIAVIGGGISGMAAAHLLCCGSIPSSCSRPRTAFGRSCAHGDWRASVAISRWIPGFIVFNHVNYPHLVGLFEQAWRAHREKRHELWRLDRRWARWNTGFAIWMRLFAQKRNIVNPRSCGMLRDIMRFNANAMQAAQNPGLTIGEFLRDLGTGDWFRDYYMLPLSGAIWSTPTQGILDFPARRLIDFFKNHALLRVTGQHQWYTVQGGSIEYVRRLQAASWHKAGWICGLARPWPACGARPGCAQVRATGAASGRRLTR